MTPYWTIEQLAEFLQVPSSWIYDRTRRRGPEAIPHLKLGKYVRFNPESEAFRAWLAEHENGTDVGSLTQRRLQTIDNKGPKMRLPQIYHKKAAGTASEGAEKTS